jgi:integrase
MEDMRTRLPLNVTRERNRHGKAVFYYRVGKGKRVRLPSFGSDEFDEAYAAARDGKPQQRKAPGVPHQGSLRWLVIEYKKSLHFRSLDAITQRRRDSFFKQMVDVSGDEMVSNIAEIDIVTGREKRSGGKGHAANNYLKAIKPMFAYAKSRGWISTDPAKSVDSAATLAGEREPWSIADIKKFEKRHSVGTMANLAMRILLFTGLRISDAVLLGKQHVRNGVVKFRPGKTSKSSGVTVTFPALPPLIEAIASTKTGDLAYLVTEKGEPFASGASFGNWFRARCKEAKVHVRAHGLRKTGPTLAAQAGATASELMAMWGWTTLAQAELYTKSANREILGGSAASKLMAGYDEAQTENDIPRTSDQGAGIERKAQ